MANRCAVCGKDQQYGNLVSHSNIKTHRSWKPNIREVRAIVGGTPRKIKVCSRCLRSGKVQRAI
ncbi:MAG TPA: 50S ribosomal protein L28 [Bacillota bacterium]|nr:50S ribosomal protein L28 [Bacillota bacterium]